MNFGAGKATFHGFVKCEKIEKFGIICHSGMETETGRITCYIKHENNWYCHDDDKCVKVDIKTIQKTAGGDKNTSYTLIYIDESCEFDF